MEFAFNEEQEELREMVREFVEKEITPFAEEMDRNNASTPDLFKKAADMGLLNVIVPEEYGGPGLDSVTVAMIYEELGKINICVQFDTKPPFTSENPTQFGYIYSTDELVAGDIVDDMLIRETRKQYDIFVSRFEYKVVSPNV